MPALGILEVDVPSFTKNRRGPLTVKLRAILIVRPTPRIVTTPDILRRSLIKRLNVRQRHLDGDPQDLHLNPWIKAWHIVGEREMHLTIDMPPLNR